MYHRHYLYFKLYVSAFKSGVRLNNSEFWCELGPIDSQGSVTRFCYQSLIYASRILITQQSWPIIKQRMIAQYMQDDSKDRIAGDNDIGTGTVSNILDEWKSSARFRLRICKRVGRPLYSSRSRVRFTHQKLDLLRN